MAEQSEKIILEVGLNNQQYIERTKATLVEIQKLKDAQKVMQVLGEQNSLEYTQNAEKLKGLNLELRANTTLSNNYTDSIKGLRAELSLQTFAWSKLSEEERENTEQGRALAASIKATSDKLKEQEGGVGNNTRSVGSYKEAIEEALSAQLPFFSEIQNSVNSFNSMAGGIKSAASASGVLKTALAATGIGLIIVAIGTLMQYFTRFEKGIDLIEQKTAFLRGAFDKFISLVIGSGEKLIKALSSPVKLIQDIGNFLKNPIQGFKDLGDAASSAAKEISAAGKAAEAIKVLEQDLEDVQISNIKTFAKLEAQRDKALIQSRDRTKSEKERLALQDQAVKLDKDLLKVKEDQAKAELRIAQAKVKSKAEGLDNPEDRNKHALADANIIKVRSESDKFEEKRINERNKVLDQQQAAEEKASEKRKEIAKKSAEDLKAADDERIASLNRTNDLVITARQKESLDLIRSFEEKVKTYKKYNKTTEQLEIELTANLKRVRDKQAKEDAEIIKANLEQIEDLTAASIEQRGLRELSQLEIQNKRKLEQYNDEIKETVALIALGETSRIAILKTQIDARNAFEAQAQAEKLEKQREFNQQEVDLFNELERQKAEAAILDAGSPAEKLALRQEQLDLEYQQDIDNAIRKNEDITLITAQYNEEQRALEEEKNQAALDSFTAFSTSFQGLVNKNSLAYKIAADIQARANAAMALQNNILIIQENIKALAKQGGLPFPANIVAIFSTLAALGSAIASAKTLFSMPKGFANGVIGFKSDGLGSMVNGPGTGTSDSVNARLSNGESVINARSTKMYAPLLSAINEAGGGRSLGSSLGNSFASGGIFDGGSTNEFASANATDANAISEAVVAAVSNIKIVTAVEDITSGINNKVSISERVTID